MSNEIGPIISFERPYSKEGAPACGLYLSTPEPIRMQLFVQQLRHAFAAINQSPHKRNMHALELRFPKEIYDKEREDANTLVALCKRNGIVPIVNGDLGLAVECGAEGIIVFAPEDVAEARRVLGDAAIIGVDCGNSQEVAEQALAEKVDFVKLSYFFGHDEKDPYADIALLLWWSTLTPLPAVAVGSMEEAYPTQMVRAGAGFIAPGDWVWEHELGPKQAIFWLQECIEAGLSKPKLQ